MVIYKNAIEYQEKLEKLQSDAIIEIYEKTQKYNTSINNCKDFTTRQDWDKYYKDLRDITNNAAKPVFDFEKEQPRKPTYILKKGRKFYEAKYTVESPYLWISDTPLNTQMLNEINFDWVIELTFSDKGTDIVICVKCKQKFIRFKPHQKKCPACQHQKGNPLTEPDKHRYCLYCGKHLSNSAHGKKKYCCGACRTAACEKRKSVIVSPARFGERVIF